MAQLSRPYQIALVAIMFMALAWFVFLHGHGSSQEPASSSPSGSSSAAVSASKPGVASSGAALGATEAKKAAAPTPIYKGAAPGVEGLSRAIAKAHAAVAISQQNAKQLEAKSAQASDEAPAAQASSASVAHGAAVAPAAPATDPKAPSKGGATTKVYGNTQANTSAVESELKAGKTVLILFWNPLASDDRAVRKQVEAAKAKEGKKVAAHYALAREVGSFGSITRNIPVYQTPTLLVIGSNKQVETVVGFPDAFGVEQAISEARH
jgi:hypothetical protein